MAVLPLHFDLVTFPFFVFFFTSLLFFNLLLSLLLFGTVRDTPPKHFWTESAMLVIALLFLRVAGKEQGRVDDREEASIVSLIFGMI